MSSILRTMKRRPIVARRKARQAAAFAAYVEAEIKVGRKPMAKRLWREKWAEK